MLKQLKIKDIVLIASADIPFEYGLNVISGETGAGKSALMAALKQIQGARVDVQLIRHGYEKGVIEAVFDIEKMPQIRECLESLGIDHNPGEELLIRRELSNTGKNRAFINHQQVQLTILKQVSSLLFEIVGQHASQELFQLNQHLEIIDQFGDLESVRNAYTHSYEKKLQLSKRLIELRENEQKRIREIEICQRELNEIEEAELAPNEEEELFSEYTRLANSESLARLSEHIAYTLDSQVHPSLHALKKSSEELTSLDCAIEEAHQLLSSAAIEIQELATVFRNYHSKIEQNPCRMEEVNQRLSAINQLKRRYGPTVDDILKYSDEQSRKLEKLENSEAEIEELSLREAQIEKECQHLADHLTRAREQTAEKFAKAMTLELQKLNMPHALFYVDHCTHEKGRMGQDTLEFYFTPNKGEKKVPIRDCASGGEVSRLLLAIQTLLAGKGKIPSLIFDEIDANIGGQTAVIVGEKLKQISQNHQVLCITHFPQVANCAAHHIQISKKENDGRTVTTVEVLEEEKRKSELLRMVGKS